MKKIKILELKSELGAGTRGASLGPDAIKIAALDFGSTFFKKYPPTEIPNENAALLEPVRNSFAKRIPAITKVCKNVELAIANAFSEPDAFVFLMAGDHSTAFGTVSGIKKAFKDKRIGVIWIDAHADLHSPYTTPSGNMHGMTLCAMLNEDNKELAINKPDPETIKLWENYKKLPVSSPVIQASDLVIVSMRDLEHQESALIKKNNVRIFNTTEIRRKAIERSSIEILNYLDACDLIYISFDVDSMDSSISKGTGTPVPNGISEKEAGSLISNLLRSKKVCCLEIVEVNPTLDKENKMAENTFEILQKAVNQLVNDF